MARKEPPVVPLYAYAKKEGPKQPKSRFDVSDSVAYGNRVGTAINQQENTRKFQADLVARREAISNMLLAEKAWSNYSLVKGLSEVVVKTLGEEQWDTLPQLFRNIMTRTAGKDTVDFNFALPSQSLQSEFNKYRCELIRVLRETGIAYAEEGTIVRFKPADVYLAFEAIHKASDKEAAIQEFWEAREVAGANISEHTKKIAQERVAAKAAGRG